MTAPVLVVPKAPVPVELRDCRGRQHAGELYVGGGAVERETLQSILIRRRFVPVKSGGALELVHRDQLLWVRIDLLTALDELDSAAETAPDSKTAQLRVTFGDGTSLEGSVRYLLPSQSSRLSDYLEVVPAYFPVRTSDHVYLVNRDRVMSVTPICEVV